MPLIFNFLPQDDSELIAIFSLTRGKADDGIMVLQVDRGKH